MRTNCRRTAQLIQCTLLLLFGGCAVLQPVHDVRPNPSPALKSVARIPIGVAVRPELLDADSRYRNTVLTQFNSITPENALKMDVVQPANGTFDFAQADALADFARTNRLRLRGHPLIWHRQLPEWLKVLPASQIPAVLDAHIQTVARRYGGLVASWDVVNEAFTGDGKYRKSIWFTALGENYIERAFRLARLADPAAKLFYNDFDIERPGPKFDAVYRMLQELRNRGVPVDGVGLQTHIRPGYTISEFELETVISQFADLGLSVEISELDVGLSVPSNSESRRTQSESYAMIGRVCSRMSACQGITLWGVNDLHSWIPKELAGVGEATLFDDSYLPKAGFAAFRDALAQPMNPVPEISGY